MKKIVGLALVFLMFAVAVQASPFIATDSYPAGSVQPNYFLVSIDGGTAIKSIAVGDSINPGRFMMKFDLGIVTLLSAGSHNATISACTDSTGTIVGGCSTTVPFAFSNSVPLAPTGVKLIP
jgi:hypothetical protein